MSGYKLIPLYKSHESDEIVAHSKVDDEDYERVNQFKWHLCKDGYAGAIIDGKMKLMHYFVLNM